MAKTSASTRPEFTDPVAAHLTEIPGAGVGTEHLQTHILWRYFFAEDELDDHMAQALKNGKERADAPRDRIVADCPQGSSLQALGQIKRGFMKPSDELLAVPPECAGALNLLKLVRAGEIDGSTGEITAECSGFEFTFIDPYYARNFPWYRQGKKYYFALYGIALDCDAAAASSGGALTPCAVRCCYGFSARVLAVKPGNFLDARFTHVLAQLSLNEDRTVSLPVNLCASKYALSGYEPHEHDEISGNVCLLGHLVTKEPPRADGGVTLFDGRDFSAF
ncbi:MAG: hypothetical protein SPL30_06085 [Succinivibrio sp.]|nr:hypothetical protein [Succinivibrio sp.]